LAWLLQLTAELGEWGTPEAKGWAKNLEPLAAMAAARIRDWLPKLTRPIRVGEHTQTAFAFGLVLDWARDTGDQATAEIVRTRAPPFSRPARVGPRGSEPSGQDFLSPCLAEADLMRRVLSEPEFARWLTGFLPRLPADGSAPWLAPGVVTDPTDPQLA